MRLHAKGTVAAATCLVLFAGLASAALAQDGESLQRVIAVSSSGVAKVRPDLAIVLLEIRSTSPLAANALEELNGKRTAVANKLKDLGFKDSEVQFSGSQFTPAGGRLVMVGGQRPTGFDVYNTLQLRMPNLDPAKQTELAGRIASILDELGRAGASVAPPDMVQMSLGGSSAVIFTVQNADKGEQQAYEQALANARPVAEQLAKAIGVKIIGVHSVRVATPRPIQRPGSVLPELTYSSTSPNEIPVRVDLVVNYSFK
jgi:uncharacterized protein